MGRHGDRKRHRNDHYKERTEFGVANTLKSVKRRRLSDDAPKDDYHPQDKNGSLVNVKDDDGWQTVPSTSSRRNRRHGRRSSDHGSTYPTLSYSHKISRPLLIEDFRDLALYVLADGTAPNWVAISHSRAISKVVVTMVPGLDNDALKRAKTLLSNLQKMYEQRNKREKEEDAALNGGEDSKEGREDILENALNGDGNSAPPNDNDVAKISWTGFQDFLDLVPLNIHDWLFNDTLPTRAPGDSKYNKVHSPLQAMLMAPEIVDKTNPSSRNDKHFKPIATAITHFIHTADELREAEYPIHPATFTSNSDAVLESSRRESSDQSKAAGWFDSDVSGSRPLMPAASLANPRDEITQGLEIYAIDCEMVLTSDQKSSLARISVVSWLTGKVIIDKYVKPEMPIENYFTQYSGITEAILRDITTKLIDVQQELLRILTPSTVLLGHSLESDLNALKMTHPFIIDTSMLFPHPRGLPLRSSLKFLANKYLRREIQMGGANGHNSVEDARAVLDLVKLKCEKGPKFGTPEANGEPIFKRLSKYSEKAGKLLTSAIVEYGSSPERGLGKDATYAIGCQNDDDITAGMLRAINGDEEGKEVQAGGANFVWGRLRALEFTRGWITNNNVNPNTSVTTAATNVEDGNPSDPTSTSSVDVSQDEIDREILRTLRRLSQIRQSLPPTSMLMLISGTSDVRPVLKLQAMQSQYRKEFKVKKWDELTVRWTDTEEQALRNAAEKARQGWAWIGIK